MLKFSFYPQFLISEYLRDFIYLFLITKQSQNSLKFLKLAEITSRSDVNKYKIKFSNQSTEAENSYAVTILKTSTFQFRVQT